MQRKPNGVVIYEPGEQIIKEGNKDKAIYFLISGKVGVYKAGNLIGVIDKPNSPIGEISAILGSERTATCIAMEKSQLVEYKGGIDEILAKYPKTAKAILVSLAERVAKSSEAITGGGKKITDKALESATDKTQESKNNPSSHEINYGILESLGKLRELSEDDIVNVLKFLSEKELSFILARSDQSLKTKLIRFLSERKLKMIEDLVVYYSKNDISSAECKILEEKITDIVSAILEEKGKQQKR